MTTILFWLTIKHFICDFPLQALPWMYKNKGTYGHPGGIAHALIHFVGTAIVLFFTTDIPPQVLLFLAASDLGWHYHIDYAKVRFCNAFDLKPHNSEWFWIILGFDQLLHMLTYFAIAYMVFAWRTL